MLETSARLLRLLSLFQGRRYWTGCELAERLEVNSRTLRRDVDKLRSLGYPVHSTSGAGGGYQMGAGSTMPPLLLDDEEAIAVAIGLRYAATGAIQGVGEASVRALAKIEQILPARLAKRVSSLQTMVVTLPDTAKAVDAGVLQLLAAACRDCETLHFRYRSFSGVASARSVEPHRVVHTGRCWYLVAWDSERNDWRTFRVDRMERRITAGARFVPREAPSRDLAAYVAKGWLAALPIRARVKLFASAEKMTERVHPGIGLIEPIDDESCYIEVGASSYDSLAMHLGLFGVDFEVTEPKEFVEATRRQASRYRRSVK